MSRIKFVTFVAILICLLIVIPASFAADNQTDIEVSADSQDNVTAVQEDVIKDNDFYFNASIENDDGNGSSDNPYKQLNASGIINDSVIYLASGEYDFNDSADIYNVTIIGENAPTTIIKNARFTVFTSFTLYNVTLMSSTLTNHQNLTAVNCIFKDSSSTGYGGAIYSSGIVNLDNCSFLNNSAREGGAIYISGGYLNANNSFFIANYALSSAGAISSNAAVSLNNCSFANNSIRKNNNYSSLYGGAIKSAGVLNLSGCSFTNNSAESFRNKAGVYGGAVYATGVVNIDNCSFADNSVNSTGTFGKSYGGAVYASNVLNIKNSSFIRNCAERGGVIYVNNRANLINSVFEDNCASVYGGVIFSGGVVDVDNCSFSGNSAVVGGVIYLKDGTLNMDNSSLSDNYAELYGGAITTVTSSAVLNNITGKRNAAQENGGAIYTLYCDFRLFNSTFEDNSAQLGSALFIDQSEYNLIEDNTFTRNTLCSFYNSNSTIENNTFSSPDELIETSDINMFIGNGNYTIYNYRSLNITELPDRYDLRDYGYVTPVKNQGSNGNCWAFAVMATLESNILMALGEEFDLSESNLKNLFGNYGDYGWTVETNTGGYTSMGYNYLASWMGPVLESDDPYIIDTIFSGVLDSIMHVQNVMFIERSSLDDTEGIKKIIMTYGAVFSQIYASFNGNKQYYQGDKADHAIAVVGWDDSLEFSGAPGKGGWIIKNSWGADAGDHGYYYVSYYDTSCLPVGKNEGAFVFILNDTLKFDKNYQYDIQGKTDYFLNSTSSVWYKNIYNATEDEYLAAVSTYFQKQSNYTFTIYVNNEFRLTQSGFTVPGYFTFNLNEFIPLKAGDVFEIVFNTTVDGDSGVPISERVSFNKFYYKENTSFLSYDGQNWQDLYNLTWVYSGHTYNSAVACIKAFTVYDLVNTTMKLTSQLKDGFKIIAEVLNQYGRPVTGGNVTFNIDGEIYQIPLVGGLAILELFDVPKDYHVYALYQNPGYISSNDTIIFNTSFINTTLTLNVTGEHNPVNITAYVVNELGYLINQGNVIFTFTDGSQYCVNVSNGAATLIKLFESFGNFGVSAVYNSIYYYKSSDAQSEFNVSLINTNITLTNDNEYNAVHIKANVSDEYGNAVDWGNVTFIVDGTSYTVEVVNGSAFLNYSFKNFGLNVIYAVYDGLYYYNSSSATSNVTVKSTIISDDATKTYNSKYQFTLLDEYGNPLNNTQITVNINSNNHTLITDENGNAEFEITLNPAKYVMTITNPVNNEVKNQTINVVKRITGNSAVTMYYGAGKYYKVMVLDDDGNIAKGVEVTFKINNKKYIRTTDSNGYASLKISQNPGKYTVTALYKGYLVANKVTVKTTLITKNIKVKKSKTIKFTAKLLNKNGKILKNKKVTFKFKGKTYKVKTNKKGKAILRITNKYKAGKYTIKTSYGKLQVKNTITIK